MTKPAQMTDAELAARLRMKGSSNHSDEVCEEAARRLTPATPAQDVMDEAGELCELLGWVGKEGAAKLSDVAAIVAFATRREAAARREERVMSDKPDFAAADEIAGQVVESATDDDLRGTMLYTIARAYQAARREIERLQSQDQPCACVHDEDTVIKPCLMHSEWMKERVAAALAARKEPIPPVVENEPERDWTGRPCPACAGTGQSASQFFDETACPACGGTGDEYAARKEPGHGS